MDNLFDIVRKAVSEGKSLQDAVRLAGTSMQSGTITAPAGVFKEVRNLVSKGMPLTDAVRTAGLKMEAAGQSMQPVQNRGILPMRFAKNVPDYVKKNPDVVRQINNELTANTEWNNSPVSEEQEGVLVIKKPASISPSSVDAGKIPTIVPGYDFTGKTREQVDQDIAAVDKMLRDARLLNMGISTAHEAGEDTYADFLESQRTLSHEDYDVLLVQRNQMMRYNKYGTLLQEADFIETAQRGATKTTDDDTYNYINHLGKYADNSELMQKIKELASQDQGALFDAPVVSINKYQKLYKMTPDEINTYNYLYEKEGKESADKYIKFIDEDISTRATADLQRESQQYAEEHPVLASLVSIPNSVISGVQGAGYILKKGATGEDINPNNTAFAASISNQAIRQEVSKDMSPTGKWFYDTGMSTGDFLVLAPAGEFVALTTMGINSFANAVQDATLRGAATEQAIQYGLFVGATEVITEKIGIDNLVRAFGAGKKGIRAVLWQFIRASLPEAGEELTSGIVGDVADYLIMQDKPKWTTLKKQYMAQGMTEAEATAKVIESTALDWASQAAGGALSGGFMGGSAAMLSYVVNGSYKIPSLNETSDQKNVLKTALENAQMGEQNADINVSPEGNAENALAKALPKPERYTKAVINRVNRAAKALGVNVKWVSELSSAADGVYVSDYGMYDPNTNTIALSLNAALSNGASPYIAIAGHEVTHSLEGTGAYGELLGYVIARAQADGTYNAKMRELRQSYGNRAASYLHQELVANEVMELFNDPYSLRRLVNSQRGTVGAILNALDTMIQKLKGTPESQQFTALREKLQAALSEREGNRTGEVRFFKSDQGIVQTTNDNVTQQTQTGKAEDYPLRKALDQAEQDAAARDVTKGENQRKGRLKPANQEIANVLEMEGLDQNKIDELVLIPKSQKPDPSSYLSDKYIERYLQPFRDTGVVKIMANVPTGQIGGKGGTYVMTRQELNDIILNTKGDISKIEKNLGFDKGYLGNNPVIVYIDSTKNLRLPTGKELGANPKYWIPGGYTRGGIREAVIDPAPIGTYRVEYLLNGGKR